MKRDDYSIGGAGGSPPSPPPPRVAREAPDSLVSTAVVEITEAISEGEIDGFATSDPLESIYLDNTPLRANGIDNFKGISYDFRPGTQNQSYIPGDYDDATSSVQSVGVLVEKNNPVTRTIASSLTDAVRITIQVPRLVHQNLTNGDTNGTTVEFIVSVSSNGSNTAADLKGRGKISGKTSSAYERSVLVNLREFGSGPYSITVHRITEDSNQSNLVNDIYFKSYTEIIYAKLRYPNTALTRITVDAKYFSRVPRRSYLMKGIKVRVPPQSVYDPVNRTYTGNIWDGTFVTAWTRNPAWIFYDLVTDPRYGLGKYVPEKYLDKWNLFSIAQRCDQLVDDGNGGQEPRYSLDLYLQEPNDAKRVIQDIASNFDGMAFWHAGGIFISQDSPKQVVSLYTPANVIDGKFSYAGSSRQVRYTVALVQWNDPDDFYRISTEYVEDTTGIIRYGYREKKIVAIGCTSRGQAHRLGKRILLTSRLETDVVTFAVGLDALYNKPGDVVRIADPLREDQNRFGGRVVSGATTTTIPLDSQVTLQASNNYTLALIMPDGAVLEKPVTTSSGTVSTVNVFPPLTEPPEASTIWIIYSALAAERLYRIVSISENSDPTSGGFYEISAVAYDESKYSQIDNGTILQPLPKNPYQQSSAVIPPIGLVINDGVYVGLEGMVRYMDISWSPSADPFFREHILSWSVDGGDVTEIPVPGASYRLENIRIGAYKIEVRAKNIGGVLSAPVSLDHVIGELYQINLIQILNLRLLKGVVGSPGPDGKIYDLNGNQLFDSAGQELLEFGASGQTNAVQLTDASGNQLFDSAGQPLYEFGTNTGGGSGGSGGPTEFVGKDAEFIWETNADQVLALSDSFGTGSGGQTPWFRDFQVDIYSGGVLVRTEFVTQPNYVYTFEKSTEDGGPYRNISITVRARDFYNRYSQSSSLAVSNPPPVNFGSISLTGGVGMVFVEYLPPVDPDYAYTIIHASQQAGFTPDSTTVVNETTDRVTSFPVSANGDWYVRLQGVDAFGPTGTVYSSAIQVSVFASDATAEVTAILADPGRPGDFVVETDRFLLVKPGQTAPVTSVFGVALVDGIAKAAIHGNLIADGTIFGRSILANTITADKMNVVNLAAISANMGTVTAGTFKTNPLETGWRVEISDQGNYPIWFGTGTKNSTNAKFYLDATGNAYFSGAIAGGTIDIGNGTFAVTNTGAVEAKNITIYDDNGNVILSSGAGIPPSTGTVDWSFITDNAGLKPENNADITFNHTAGSGVNICDPKYSVFETTLPVMNSKATSVSSVTIDQSISYFGGSSLKITTTGGGDAWVYLSDNSDYYNIKISPNKKWIYSFYVRASVANMNIKALVRTSANGDHYSFLAQAPVTVGQWVKVYGVIDLSADSSTSCNIIIDNDSNSAADLWVDGIMFEEKIGGLDTASAYALPVGVGNVEYSQLSGKPTTLAAINATESNKLNSVENGATNGATFGTNIFGQINAANISTYIAGAAIDTAFIKNGAIKTALIDVAAVNTANIADLSVDTLKIKDHAVTIPRFASNDTQTNYSTTTVVFNEQGVINTIVFQWTATYVKGSYGGSTSEMTVELKLNGIVLQTWTLISASTISDGFNRTTSGMHYFSPGLNGTYDLVIRENPQTDNHLVKDVRMLIMAVKK